MDRGLRVLLVAPEGGHSEELRVTFEAEASVRRVHLVHTIDEARTWLGDISADALLVVCTGPLDESLLTLRATNPEVAVVAIDDCATGSETELLALELGIDEVVCAPAEDAIRGGSAITAVQRAMVRRRVAIKNEARELVQMHERVSDQLHSFLDDAWNRTSHELATPLTPVLFDLHGLLQRSGELDPRGQAIVARLARNLHRMDDAIKMLQSDHPSQELDRIVASTDKPRLKEPQRPPGQPGVRTLAEKLLASGEH